MAVRSIRFAGSPPSVLRIALGRAEVEWSHHTLHVPDLYREPLEVAADPVRDRRLIFREPVGKHLESDAELRRVDQLVSRAGLVQRQPPGQQDDQTAEAAGQIRMRRKVQDQAVLRAGERMVTLPRGRLEDWSG
jgi:hypothetical protein